MNITINGQSFDVIDEDNGDLLLMSLDKNLLIKNGWTELINEAEEEFTEFEGRDHNGDDIIEIDRQAARQFAWDNAENYIIEHFDEAIEVIY